MKIIKNLTFIAQYLLMGLGFAALLILLMPEQFGWQKINSQAALKPLQADSSKPNSNEESAFIAATEMLKAARQAVVTLQVRSKNYPINSQPCFYGVRAHNQNQNACSYFNSGSGVIIDQAGHIVTNAHVITFSARGQVFDQAETILVEFIDGKKAKATIKGIDLESDLALLKIDLKTNPTLGEEMNFLPLTPITQAQIGEPIYAIGTPYMGFQQTVTSGIVSAKFFSRVSNYLQIDAELRTGNSGGALINTKGKLVGITQLSTQATSNQEGTGEKILQNFAIAVHDVARVVEQLKEFGEVKRGKLGLNGDMSINLDSIISEKQLSPEFAQKLQQDIEKLPFGLGIVVTGIDANGAAEKAGIKEFDIVTQVNNQPIYNSNDLLGAIWNKKPNEKVQVTYWRNGRKAETEVFLGAKD